MLGLNQYNIRGEVCLLVSRVLGLIINIMITNVYKLGWQVGLLMYEEEKQNSQINSYSSDCLAR